MSNAQPTRQPTCETLLSVSRLKGRKSVHFDLRPDAKDASTVIAELGLLGLRKTSFAGKLTPDGREDWTLTARLGATAVQPCSVTLEPVTTRIDTDVVRRFVAAMPDARTDEEDDENEASGGSPMIVDETLEPLGREIDLMAVLTEALAIALPDYPRAAGADLGTAVFTEDGKAAMTDEDAKPFAGLAALKGQIFTDK